MHRWPRPGKGHALNRGSGGRLVSVVLPEEMLNYVHDAAKDNNTSVSHEIRRLIGIGLLHDPLHL